MNIYTDGNSVFVAGDDFVNLQESPAIFGSTHDLCVAAAMAMVNDGAIRHTSYVRPSDLKVESPEGKVLVVEISWQTESLLDDADAMSVRPAPVVQEVVT